MTTLPGNVLCDAHAQGNDWMMYNGDCVEVVGQLPDRSIDVSVYSPPFSDLFVYSESARDMGNCNDDEGFAQHYAYLLSEMFRVTRPGRLSCVHVSDLPSRKNREGHIGIRDFSGAVIRAHEAAGWHYHSRVTIWKDPVTEMQRTKSHGLLYKNIQDDSTRNRVGMPDYLLIFKRPPLNAAEEEAMVKVSHSPTDFPLDQWQAWASPVWMDIDQGDTLNARLARGEHDERHMCPLQLPVIERALGLYSNRGDVVLSPFGGVGSEGVGALRFKRRYVGVELKPEYFNRACRNLAAEESTNQVGLFGR